MEHACSHVPCLEVSGPRVVRERFYELRDPFLGYPYSKSRTILESILGPLILGNSYIWKNIG